MKTDFESLTLSEKMVWVVEKVRERLLRATSALENAGVPYTVIGGNAVAAWVAKVDQSAVRNTADVDIMIRRLDFDRTKSALEGAGFVHRYSIGIHFFLDGPKGKPREAVHIMFAGEKVRPEALAESPDVDQSVSGDEFRHLDLEALVLMKLISYRDKDRTHLRDMLEIGLIDDTWLSRFPPQLADRLKHLIDNPES